MLKKFLSIIFAVTIFTTGVTCAFGDDDCGGHDEGQFWFGRDDIWYQCKNGKKVNYEVADYCDDNLAEVIKVMSYSEFDKKFVYFYDYDSDTDVYKKVCKYPLQKVEQIGLQCRNTGGTLDHDDEWCFCDNDKGLGKDGPFKCKCKDAGKYYSTAYEECIEGVPIVISDNDIDAAYRRIRGLLGDLSVWRDENGNFNRARLFSDGVATVVLGTVGGAVTANVVKRAQIKQGFEDIQCYIGGQPLGDYGDEIIVK